MRLFLVSVILLTGFSAIGQSLKTVKKKSKYLLEQYQVRADNDTIRDGTYQKYFRDGDVLLEKGQYEQNKRVGIWTFYDPHNLPELVYNYSTGTVITNNRRQADSTGVIQEEGRNITVVLLPPPLFLASSYQVLGIMARELRYPASLERGDISALSCQPLAAVSPVGTHYRVVLSHPDKEFQKNALQAVHTAFEGVEWLPGRHAGQPVTAIYTLPQLVMQGMSIKRMYPQRLP